MPLSDQRFTYDGTLPKINSKYRKQSVDIDIGAFTARKDSLNVVPLSPHQDKFYDINRSVVQSRTKGVMPFTTPRQSDLMIAKKDDLRQELAQ